MRHTIRKKSFSLLNKSFFLILTGLILLYSAAQAQSPILQQNYSFSRESYSIYELATVLQQQADISISYDAQKIKSGTKIKLPKSIMTTKELTAFLNKHHHIRSKFIGRHIIWQKDEKAIAAKPKKKPQRPGKEDMVRKRASSSAAEQKIEREPIVAEKAPDPSIPDLDSVTVFKDTFSVDATNLAGMGWEVSESAAFEGFHKDIQRLDKPEIGRAGNAWYERSGLSLDAHANEFFYGDPRVNLHWSNISVNAQYAVRNGAAHYRFGAAYRKQISSNAGLSLWFDYGQLPAQNKSLAYQYDSIASPDPDSPSIVRVEGSQAYRLSGDLLKVGLDLNWKLAERLELFSGVTINRMQTTILHQNSAKAPDRFFPAEVALRQQDFEMLPQFLRIADNFSSARENYDRTWIGFQLGLRFYIFIPKNKWE